MLITSQISIKINHRVRNYYQKLGYDVSHDEIQVNIKDLPENSSYTVLCACDDCGKESNKSYQSYNKILKKNGKVLCKKCSLKYRENPFSNENVKQKIKETLLKKYGVDSPIKNKDILNKKNNTMIEKYGVINPLTNEKIKEKAMQKVANRSEDEKKLKVEKWRNNIDFKNARLNFESTMMKKYGVKNALELKKFKDKVKNKLKDKNSEQKEEILNKRKETNLIKYGVEFVTQNIDIKNKSAESKRINSIERFIKKHKKYNILTVNYEKNIIKGKCDKHGTFELRLSTFYHRMHDESELCPECNKLGNFTGLEKELVSFIKDNYNGIVEENKRSLLNNEFEIDIFLPEKKLAFEFNGLYWHCELNKDKDYHLRKTEICESLGIHLIHIYEDDWLFKGDIVKSRILNLLGKSTKIYARKCEVKEVEDNNLIREFLNYNHIQGYVGSKYKYGLFYNNELISLMIFGNPRISMNQNNTEHIELLRFCNKVGINVIGGASKLFKYFINEKNPKTVLSYADRSWSQGNVYFKLGFDISGITKPNYYYIIERKRRYRFNYAKYKLIKQGFDVNKSEHQIMLERKIYRIYDSGSIKFVWKVSEC